MQNNHLKKETYFMDNIDHKFKLNKINSKDILISNLLDICPRDIKVDINNFYIFLFLDS